MAQLLCVHLQKRIWDLRLSQEQCSFEWEGERAVSFVGSSHVSFVISFLISSQFRADQQLHHKNCLPLYSIYGKYSLVVLESWLQEESVMGSSPCS